MQNQLNRSNGFEPTCQPVLAALGDKFKSTACTSESDCVNKGLSNSGVESQFLAVIWRSMALTISLTRAPANASSATIPLRLRRLFAPQPPFVHQSCSWQ